MYCILYNPKSKRGNILKKVNKIYKKFSKTNDCYKINLLEINNKEKTFLNQCRKDDTILLCGGDGTLDQFLNRIYGEPILCRVYFYSCGSGNDFAREFKKKFIDITECIQDLPKIRVNGREQYVFINGIGMGIDAVVCRSKAQYIFSEVKKGYFSIAVASFKTFRPYSLDIEIDQEVRHYDNVWFFVCNHGKFIGGGMRVAPKAKRADEYLDICIVHSLTPKKILLMFPLIYLGKHLWLKNHIEYIRCKKCRAVADGCTVLQRDGEVLDYVREIEVER